MLFPIAGKSDWELTSLVRRSKCMAWKVTCKVAPREALLPTSTNTVSLFSTVLLPLIGGQFHGIKASVLDGDVAFLIGVELSLVTSMGRSSPRPRCTVRAFLICEATPECCRGVGLDRFDFEGLDDRGHCYADVATRLMVELRSFSSPRKLCRLSLTL